MVDPAVFGMGSQDEHDWTQEELREWILTQKRADFARFIEWGRCRNKASKLLGDIRHEIEQAWESGEADEDELAMLQRKDDALSNILFGMILAKTVIFRQRTAEFVDKEIEEYIEHGLLANDPAVIEDSVKGFVLRRRDETPEGSEGAVASGAGDEA